MTNTDFTTNPTTSPTFTNYRDEALTAVELREAARLLDLVGAEVVMTHPDGSTFEGILTQVYWTDGLAANIVRGESFSFGPLYGATISALVALG